MIAAGSAAWGSAGRGTGRRAPVLGCSEHAGTGPACQGAWLGAVRFAGVVTKDKALTLHCVMRVAALFAFTLQLLALAFTLLTWCYIGGANVCFMIQMHATIARPAQDPNAQLHKLRPAPQRHAMHHVTQLCTQSVKTIRRGSQLISLRESNRLMQHVLDCSHVGVGSRVLCAKKLLLGTHAGKDKKKERALHHRCLLWAHSWAGCSQCPTTGHCPAASSKAVRAAVTLQAPQAPHKLLAVLRAACCRSLCTLAACVHNGAAAVCACSATTSLRACGAGRSPSNWRTRLCRTRAGADRSPRRPQSWQVSWEIDTPVGCDHRAMQSWNCKMLCSRA
jgi:hypothetical protein